MSETDKENNTSMQYDRVDTLGVKEFNIRESISTTTETNELQNKECLVKDKNLNIENFIIADKNDIQVENKIIPIPDNVPSLPLKELLNIQLPNNQLNLKITHKLNTQGKEKHKIKYQNFEDENISSYSSSLPPNEDGEVIVNISAIEIDKNDISFYVDNDQQTDKKEAIKKKETSKCKILSFILLYVFILLLIGGIILFIVQSAA